MKNLFTLCLLLAMSTAMAQTTPRSEFTITLSESNLVVKPGESKSLTVWISRSKSFAKGNANLGFSSRLPEGITVVYEPSAGNLESSTATITAAPGVASGTYSLVFNATVYNKTKGSVLRLEVSNGNVAAK